MKPQTAQRANANKQPTKRKEEVAEEISSDSDEEIDSVATDSDLTESEEEETAQEKKIRLAKNFIEQIENLKESQLGEKDQTAFVSRRLEDDLNTKTGKLRRDVAQQYSSGTVERQLKGHRLTVTCAVISHDSKYVFSASKDGSIIKWSLETGAKVNVIRKKLANDMDKNSRGHSNEVLCLALSTDDKFLASGGKDKSIKLWYAETCEFYHAFEGHRDAVSGVVFRANSHQLFSASFDRSVKVWNVDERAYVETMFGHQDKILAIDAMSKERCITCGARDRTIRLWKIVEESQLVYNGPNFDSIDCVAFLNEENFISGSNDGSIAVWNINKKKPIATFKTAHQTGAQTEIEPGEAEEDDLVKRAKILNSLRSNNSTCGWVSAVAALHNSDLLASGSDDGFVRLWAYSSTSQRLVERFKVPVVGVVNDLEFSHDGSYLLASVGQEHRLGRWSTIKSAKNTVVIIRLERSQTSEELVAMPSNGHKSLPSKRARLTSS